MKKCLKHPIIFSIAYLLSFSFCAIAQSIPLTDSYETVRVSYPDGTNDPALDAVKDFAIPPEFEGRAIDFTIQGADGDYYYFEDSISSGYNEGGEGVTITMRVVIGSGVNEIPVGSNLRMILGEGKKDYTGAGGTGLAFRRPFEVPGEDRWVLLAIAGGGGSGGQNYNYDARPGRGQTAGYWGRGTGVNENNGFAGGDGSYDDDNYAKGGRGYLSSITDAGVPIGSFGAGNGSFGFGGGGGPVTDNDGTAAGGGGGYSGGGGGKVTGYGAYASGGGGSWVNTDYAVTQTVTQNGTTLTPDHGYIEYAVDCVLSVTPEAELIDIVTLNSNDCNDTSPSKWFSFITNPPLGNTCSGRLRYAVYNHESDSWERDREAIGLIEKGVENTIVVVYNNTALSQKTIVYPEFEWQDEVSVTLNTPTITLNAQDLVNMTGTSTPLIENFSFQFLNDDGSTAEGEEKTFTSGAYTQKIGLVSFGGTVTCAHEMTIHVRAPEIAVDNCTSGNVELIDNVHSLFWLTPNGYHTQWQSFSPESSGTMESLYFELIDNPNNGYGIPQNATLKIYRGEGVGAGPVIYTKSLVGALSRFNTITIDETLYLEEDHVYTFAISDPDTTDWGLAFYATEDYPRGVHFLWHDWDAVFRVSLTDVCDEDIGIVSTYFEETTIGTSRSKTYTISNTGSNILTVSGITSSDGQFTIGGHEANISPGSSTTFTVNFTPTAVGEQSGTITIHSNDLDDPTYSFDAKGVGVAPLQVSCQNNLVFYLESNDQNGKVDLGFWDLADTAEGLFTGTTINGSDTTIRFQCTDIGDQDITLEISTDEGLSSTCSTTVTILPPITEIEDVTLYVNRGAPLPTYEYDINTFNINCPVFSQPVQIAGLPSGSQFEVGTTTNTFEVSSGSTTLTYSFDVTVFENPFETRVSLDQGELVIEDWNTLTDDDQVTLSISDDGTVLYISGLNGSVELSGGALSYDGDTGTVVSVPINAITNGIVFHGRQGTNSITIADDLVLTGSTNGIVINDISNYVQSGAIEIEGDLTITGDADIVSTSGSYGGVVNLQGNTIDFRANNSGNLTFGTIAASGDALTDTNYLYSAGDINFTDTVTTAGDSNLVIRGEFVEQVASAVITTNELTLESAVSIDNSVYFLDAAPNNVNKLSSNTSNHLVGAIVFKDADALELGAINTDAVFVTADTFILTGATNLTIASNSSLIGAINQTATDINNPAQINHNGGTLILDSASAYAFTGAFRYTAVSGATTRISNVQVLIDTPDHTQTFGALNFFFDALTIAAGSTVTLLNKGNFNFTGCSLEGAGTIIGDVDIRNGATLNPGTDGAGGTLAINGNLKLFSTSNENSNFAPFIDNDTDFDAVTVIGTVELAGVDFEPTGSFGIDSGTEEIILIDNDGSDPVIGTFNNLPEGTGIVFGDFGGMISYVGGDGNDVVLLTDGVDPVAICQNITVPVGLNGVTVTGDQIDGGSTDDVGIAEFLINGEPSVAFTYEDLGDNPVTLTVVDAMGNTAECTATVTLTIDETESFTTQWETTSNNETISIPTAGTGYNYVVDWGDGTIATGITGSATHSYATADTYTVRVLGDFPHIYFNNGGDRLKLVEIQQWGAIAWGSMERAFLGCENLIISATDAPDLSNVTNMERMLQAAGNNIDINLWADISHWDVSTIENMSSLFRQSNFNQDISSWTVDSVSDMKRMFQANSQFNQNISSWNVGNVTNMFAMFFSASSFDQDLLIWDVSQVENMRWMFRNTTSFNQNLGAWDISSLQEGMDDMFFNAALSIENYDNTLMGWATLDAGETQIPTGVTFDGGNSQYCLSELQRQELMDTYGWTITDGGSGCNEIAFITTWEVTSDDLSITIPTTGSTGYDYIIDWGDGTIETGVTGDTTHNYTAEGMYTVSIAGDFPRIYFRFGGDHFKIQEVQQWGNVQWSSMRSAFSGCQNLNVTATDVPDLSGVTSLVGMFEECANLTGTDTDFSLWDTSTITDMSSMFRSTTSFNGNISTWDTNNVVSMARMFALATNFNQPLNNWNVGNVTSMYEMFSGATSFNQDLNGWDVGNVSNMRWMFNGATSFNQPLNNWDIGNVSDMGWMFDGAISFDQDLGSWDISSLAMADGMFLNAGFSTENYDNTLIAWATLDAVAGETQIPSNITFDGGNSQYCLSQTQRQELMNTYGWTISDGGKSPVCFDSDSFVTVWETTSDNESITIPTTGSGYSYNVSWGDGTIDTGFTGDAIHQYATAGTYTVSIVSDFPRIYFNNGGDRLKIREVTQWGSTAWTSMASAFRGCEHLDITATDLPDLSQVTNVSGMLASCVSLVGNSSFNAWDVSNVEIMQEMFAWTTFNQPLSNWNVSNVVYMGDMFYDATSFNQDLSGWDVGNVIDMGWMFDGATSFNQDLSGWDVGNVLYMNWMFSRATSFNQDLSGWDVGNVVDMMRMFYGATDFDQDLGSWDISSLAEADGMFLNAGLSTGNYDNTLMGWATLDAGETQVPLNIVFDGGSSQYCFSETQRQELIDTYGWTISDGGKLSICSDSNSFVTVWETTSDNESITIPTTGSGYSYNVSWGDGTVDTGFTGDATHQYATAGTYTVSIVGNFPRIYFNNGGDRLKIREVTQWGSTAWTSMHSAFEGCANLDVTATDTPNLSNTGSLSEMFAGCTSLVGTSAFASWDTSHINSMNSLFLNAINFNQDIGSWDTGRLTDLNGMFNNATSFNQNLGTWDVSSINEEGPFSGMRNMFVNAGLSTENYDNTLIGWATLDAGETEIPLSIVFDGGNSQYCLSQTQRQELIDTYGWTISDGGKSSVCFDSDSFVTVWETTSDNESITIPTTGSGYSYNVSWGDGTIDTGFMGDATHQYATSGTYTVSIVGNFPRIYFNRSGDRLKIREVTQWGSTAWTSMQNAFTGCRHLDITATDLPDLSQVTNVNNMLASCVGLVGNSSFNAWDVTNVETMQGMFAGATNFNQPLSNWNVSNVVNMGEMFYGATSFNQPLNNWNVGNVTSMQSMFSFATSFNQDLSGWNVGNVIDMGWMFDGATSFNQDLNGWDVGNVLYMNWMFYGATSFNQGLSGWNVGNVIDMMWMFDGATSFNQDLSGWNVGNVIDMGWMFYGATDFDQDLGSWDISSLTGANDMFYNATLSTENYDSTLIGWATLDAGETQIPSGITFNGGSSRYCLSETQRQELIDSYGWSITDGGLGCPTDIFVAPKVYLQGAAVNPNAGEETLMRDDFRVAGTGGIRTSPYVDGVLIDDLSVFMSYSGPGAFVDWVWVELRDKDDPSVVIAGQSGMLTRNGNIVDPTDISLAVPLNFYVPVDAYYVMINHRNHVGIMSSTAVSLSGTVIEVDLSSDPSTVQGGDNSVMLLANGSYGMYTGDYDANAQIQNTDANAVVPQIGVTGYEGADMDLNTQIQNTDVNVLISPNIGRGEQFGRPSVPTEQLSTDVTLAFANAQITNDGVDDYYEADIVISGTTDFYVGSGQVYLDYATAAFGENISANGNIEYSQPDGSILGYSFGAFSPAYRDFIENDNITSRVSLSFQQNVGLTGLETAPELQITSTPKVLFHIKIRYTDVSEEAGMCFYSEGIFQDQFFTACGGTATADCTNTPGVQITNDSYDCSEAGVGTLGITEITDSPILLYPNPASTSFRIKGLTTASHVRVYDVNGRLIIEERRSDDSPIDMNAYDDGVYLVKITSDSATATKQLIKKAE